MMNRIIECVPNFSEGVDLEKVDKIVDAFRGKKGVKLLNYSSDPVYNRSVVTVIGEPQALKDAVVEAIGKAVELIDMNAQKGQHPRLGAVDVVPFIPIKNVSMEEAIDISKSVASEVAKKFNLPVFLYEKSASSTERENLSVIRKGEYEGLIEKMSLPEWAPDFGDAKPHPTAGAVVIGARDPLIAYNINLGTNSLKIANAIAKKVRYIGGGLRFVKAIGIEFPEKGITQVSINLTNYTKTAIYQIFEMVKMEAKRYGVNVQGSEIIGLVPLDAIVDTAVYYLGLEDFSAGQVLDSYFIE